MVLVSCDRTVHGALESDAEGSEKDSVCDELQWEHVGSRGRSACGSQSAKLVKMKNQSLFTKNQDSWKET